MRLTKRQKQTILYARGIPLMRSQHRLYETTPGMRKYLCATVTIDCLLRKGMIQHDAKGALQFHLTVVGLEASALVIDGMSSPSGKRKGEASATENHR